MRYAVHCYVGGVDVVKVHRCRECPMMCVLISRSANGGIDEPWICAYRGEWGSVVEVKWTKKIEFDD